MIYCRLIEKATLLIILKLSYIIQQVSSLGCPLCISIWDPFCKDDILFTPYVRVFQKGRPGAMLRDRGPGFIDVTGMQDIYVCTNGLVMLYYMKTRGMGEVYEHGELHWAPHHCEMYNPSCNNGQPGDFPRKTLLSILLIGHPQDYRRPALQMFIAPMFDPVYGDYINITSLIMVGADGECLIEKGVERARLRVRNREPTSVKNATGEKPAVFCQLDAQRKLGQRGIITLAAPGDVMPETATAPLFKYPLRDLNASFINSPYERPNKHARSETGPAISPRFHASRTEAFAELQDLAQVADEVYAALINDRKMRFVGCLQYPDFSAEQYRIIFARFQEGNYTKELNLSHHGEIGEESEFWVDEINPPWPYKKEAEGEEGTNKKKRFEMYDMKPVSDTEGYPAYNESKAALDEAVEELREAKKNASGDEASRKLLEYNVTEQQIKLSLWPLKKGYEGVYKYLLLLKAQMEEIWGTILKETGGPQNVDEDPKPPNFEELDNEDNKAKQLAEWRHALLRNISSAKFERRFEPYNRYLIDQYNNYTLTNAKVMDKLRQKSVQLGPMISNAEAMHSRFRIFVNLLKKVSNDLKNAVKKIEKTGKPFDGFNGKHPMDNFFMDTMIEISDANGTDAAGGEGGEGENAENGGEGGNAQQNHAGKACFELPTKNETCFHIRPESARANALLKNRQGTGKVKDFAPEDMWRQKVLDLIEQIFMQVCPYISQDFADAINKILKGYLMASPLGTGLKQPISGTRLYSHDHNYQAIVYNMTYNQTFISDNQTGFTGALKFMDPFWEQIQAALEDCSARAKPMQFWHTEEGDKPVIITYRKYFHNNGTEQFYDVDELTMQEKADYEFSFNWAIDMNWRIFATVLGICMPAYEKTIPLISARFYALYSNDFLHPLRQIWMSNRDNPVHRVILGNYYGRGKADKWAKICMESSFVESGDRNYRPPRNLYVNAFTEMNYFVSGPLAGTSGLASVANGM